MPRQGLLGVNEAQAFEAQAAILLQELAQHHGRSRRWRMAGNR